MKALTQSVLAAAMLLALPFAAAEACTTGAWNGNTSAAAAATAAGPNTGQRAYSGACSLRAGPNAFVTDNTPNAEGTYQALFYVYTSGTGKVFSATTADSNGGTEVIGVSYSTSTGQFTFSGATGVAPIAAPANTWQSVRVTHQSGQPFSVEVRGGGQTTSSQGTGTSATASVGSASLGLFAGGSGTFDFDNFESTRSTTPIARLCRGDTNANDTRDSGDITRMRLQFLSNGVTLAGGQPDCNEDGAVNSADITCARLIFLGGNGACSTGF